MRNKGLYVLLMGIFVLGFALLGYADTVEETFKKAFPQIKYDAINSTDIKGIYEVVAGANIWYFAPDPGYFIMGEIKDKNWTSLTAKRRNEIIASKTKNLPLDKAIKIGNGKSLVVEFTDPDCPYCRKASTFFGQRTDVTRYVFFAPLPMHPDAENKVKYIFCAQDRALAYEEAVTGKLDNQKYQVCKKQDVEDLVKVHKELATKMGIPGTPFFVVNDKPISGADIPQIEEALKQK